MLGMGKWHLMSFSFVNMKTHQPPPPNPEVEIIKDRNKEATDRNTPGENRQPGGGEGGEAPRDEH